MAESGQTKSLHLWQPLQAEVIYHHVELFHLSAQSLLYRCLILVEDVLLGEEEAKQKLYSGCHVRSYDALG